MNQINRIMDEVGYLFPHCELKIKKIKININSDIYFMGLIDNKNLNSFEIAVKSCHFHNSYDILNEFRNQTRFFEVCSNSQIYCPKPLHVNPAREFIIMENIAGISMKQYLLWPCFSGKKCLNNLIDVSALALSMFHRAFRKSDKAFLSINSNLININSNSFLSINELFLGCNLKMKVQPFIDFVPWNILITDKIEPKICLIDFPEANCISSPHLDLARFWFGLEILKQYPQYKFLKLDWWDLDTVYKRFLNKYCEDLRIKLNDNDFELIDTFKREYAKELLTIYKLNTNSLKMRLEHLYLKRFINNSLSMS